MRKTAALLAFLLVVGLLTDAALPSMSAQAAKQCGEWRWPVKTLSDKKAKSVNYQPLARTVGFLRSLQAPSSLGAYTPRQPGVEMKTYRIQVFLKLAKIEDDSDIHLVVAAPKAHKATMIVEFPDIHCTGAAQSYKKAKIKSARDALIAACPDPSTSGFEQLKGTATITGVGFWDEIHGQTGVAPNGIELHPVLSFSSSNCASASSGGSGGGGGGGGGGKCTPGYSPCLVWHGGGRTTTATEAAATGRTTQRRTPSTRCRQTIRTVSTTTTMGTAVMDR